MDVCKSLSSKLPPPPPLIRFHIVLLSPLFNSFYIQRIPPISKNHDYQSNFWFKSYRTDLTLMVKKNKAGQMNALMELGPVTGCRDTITCGYNVGFLYKSKGILCIRYNFLIRKVIACQP